MRKFEGKFVVMGHQIELGKLKNPHIIRAIKERGDAFLFNYGDHTEHNERYGDYTDTKKHQEYEDTVHTEHGWSREKNAHTDEHREKGGFFNLPHHADYDHRTYTEGTYRDASYGDTYYDW